MVSHDRHFLDRAVNRVVEIQNHRFHEYDCGFVEFVRRKRGKTRQLEREFRHEEELLAFEAEAIQDRREATRNPSRALARRLADIRKRQAPREVDTIVTGIYRGMRTADELCEVTQLSKRYGGQTLFDDLDFTLHRGDRLVVVGPNGCGKTTLLRVLAQRGGARCRSRALEDRSAPRRLQRRPRRPRSAGDGDPEGQFRGARAPRTAQAGPPVPGTPAVLGDGPAAGDRNPVGRPARPRRPGPVAAVGGRRW